MKKRYHKGFIRKLPKGKGLMATKQRFFKKYGLTNDSGRVYRSGGKVHKEVWLVGRGWVSEAAFKRYMYGNEPARIGWTIAHYNEAKRLRGE